MIFRNGPGENSPNFSGLYGESEVCDDYPVSELRSHGNRIFMRFTTKDAKISEFQISYEQIVSGKNNIYIFNVS